MRFLYSASLLKNISFVTAPHLSINSETWLDGSQASHQAVAELKAEGVLPAQTLVWTNKHLNNLIEQDHRKVKQRCCPMPGFKTFVSAQVTLSGIELANKIKKDSSIHRRSPALGP